jgi:basic amino acid/polyamine antiporter, APA family
MLNLKGETWTRFLIWMALGFVVYFVYGRRHSRVGLHEGAPSEPSNR